MLSMWNDHTAHKMGCVKTRRVENRTKLIPSCLSPLCLHALHGRICGRSRCLCLLGLSGGCTPRSCRALSLQGKMQNRRQPAHLLHEASSVALNHTPWKFRVLLLPDCLSRAAGGTLLPAMFPGWSQVSACGIVSSKPSRGSRGPLLCLGSRTLTRNEHT